MRTTYRIQVITVYRQAVFLAIAFSVVFRPALIDDFGMGTLLENLEAEWLDF